MFTGIVQATGQITQVRRHRQGVRLGVRPTRWSHVPAVGDSISVSGCCLTVAEPVDASDSCFMFDVVPETLRKTHLGDLRIGDRVNLEHAATPGTLLGGHLVQGHVDGVAAVVSVQRPRVVRGRGGRTRRGAQDVAGEWRLRIGVPWPSQRRSDPSAGDLMQYIVPKGSICVDGTSLTVAGLWEDEETELEHGDRPLSIAPPGRGFEVALIPETLRKTTLGKLRGGDVVNLEVDSVAKTVVNWLRWREQSSDGVRPDGGRGRPRDWKRS